MFLKGSHKDNLQRILTKAIKQLQAKGNLDVILADSKAKLIIDRTLSLSDLFAIGISKVVELTTNQSQKPILMDTHHYKKVILAMRVTAQNLNVLFKYLKDKQIYLLNINLTCSKEDSKAIKQNPLRKNIRAISQVSYDFVPFLERVYQLKPDSQQISQKVSCLTSLMLSFQKFYEFEIIYAKNSKYKGSQFVNEIKGSLEQKLKILQKHSAQEYKESNQKVKLLIIDRNQDMISPLISSFNYGPMIEEMQLESTLEQFLPRGCTKILNQIFDMDFSEVTETLDKIVLQKIDCRKMNFELNNFDKAKEIIVKNYNPDTSHQEIDIHLQTVKAIITYCEKRGPRNVLQQSIVNGVNQFGIKLSSRDVVKQIRKWLKQQKQIDTNNEYLKVCMIALMIYDFWFFDRSEIMAGLSSIQKTLLEPFLTKHNGKHKNLEQKKQDPLKRMHYYRHEPRIPKIFEQWQKNSKDESKYESVIVNKSQRFGQGKCIIYIDGPMGYNQLTQLRKSIKTLSKKGENQKNYNSDRFYICCDQLLNDKRYMNWLLHKSR